MFIHTIWAWMLAHPTSVTGAIILVYVHFANALPAPELTSGAFYQFFFKFVVGFANSARAFSSKLPIAAAQAEGVATARAAAPVTVGEIVTVTKAPPADPLKVAPLESPPKT